MAEIKVKDIMTRRVVFLKPSQSVTEAAKLLSESDISGAPVVDDEDRLIGLVRQDDLIIQDVKLHFPTYIHFLDGYIYLGSLNRFEETLKKAVGAKVKDIMTTEVVTARPEDTVEDIATLMVRHDVGMIPVTEDDSVAGVVSKSDIVRSLGRD